MAYQATMTVTGKAGPGLTITAQVFTGVTSYLHDVANSVLTIYQGATVVGPIALGTTLTVTATVSSGNWTITIA